MMVKISENIQKIQDYDFLLEYKRERNPLIKIGSSAESLGKKKL